MENIKVSKTKAGIKLNGQLVGNSSLEKEEYLSSSKDINSTRPSRIREFRRTKITSELDIDIDIIKNKFDFLPQNVTQDEFDDFLERTCAGVYNQSNNLNWGNKAISGLLNDFFSVNCFKYR